MQRTFDFHTHSWWSYDAHLSPGELFAAAEAAGITTLAITDHHNMDGFASFAEAAEAHPSVKWVRGMEVSVATHQRSFDVVALGTPADAPEQLAGAVDRYRDWMRLSNRRLLDGLAALDAPFGRAQADEMLATWRPGPARGVQGEVRLPNHGLRSWLLAGGVIAEAGEYASFVDLAMAEGGGRPPLPRAEDVLPAFKAVGAVLLLAHPKRFLAVNGEAGMDAVVEETGVDGVEAGHASHTPQEVRQYREYARRRDLLVSGGSDVHFHADVSDLGRHPCDESAAAALFERLGV